MLDPKELGTMLRTARERRGLDIADCVKQTGLPGEYLAALESGDFDRLPGIAYARIYFLNYARMLRLDAEELHLLWPEPRPVSVERVKGRRGPLVVGLLVLAAVAVSVGLIVRSVRLEEGDATDPPPGFGSTAVVSLSGLPTDTVDFTQTPPSAEDLSEAPAVFPDTTGTILPPDEFDRGPAGFADTAEPTPQAHTAAEATADPETAPVVSTPAGVPYGPASLAAVPAASPTVASMHRLEVASRGQTWVLIQADGDTAIKQVVNADQVVSAEARHEFLLSAGRPGVLSVSLDGEKTQLPPRQGRSLVGHRIVPDAEDST